MIGMKGFHIKNQNFISWNITLSPEVSINATSDNSFLLFQFIYFIIEVEWCGEPTIYLMESNSTCYDVCPERYYGDDPSLTCQICFYDCYQCSDGTVCSSCNETLDFRAFNNATSRCDPLEGYYDTGVTQAQPCNISCLTCNGSSASHCLSCNSNASMILNGTECINGSDAVGLGCTSCFDNSTGFFCSACSGSILLGGTCHFAPPE